MNSSEEDQKKALLRQPPTTPKRLLDSKKSEPPKVAEEDEKTERKGDKKMNKTSQRRFGFKIQFDDYKTSNFVKVLCVTLAIIIIPLEIFLQNVLQDNEIILINNIQEAFGKDSSFLRVFMSIPLALMRP